MGITGCSGDFAEAAGVDVVDEAANGDVLANDRRPPIEGDVIQHGLFEVWEREEIEAGVGDPQPGLHPLANGTVVGSEGTAAGVVDDGDSLRAEHELADGDGADGLGDAGASIANDVDIARLEPESTDGIDAGIHAGEDGDTETRFWRHDAGREVRGEARVGGEDVLEGVNHMN